MTTNTGKVRKRTLKTWSAFGELGRRPTEYEIVTHNMNHTLNGIEMGPKVHYNEWLQKYRDSGELSVNDWDRFRDPDSLTYATYIAEQDDQETYLEGILEQADNDDYDCGLGSDAVNLLRDTLGPSRYLAHGLQMLSAYIQQLASSSYVANCAVFQTADELRRVQLTAYRTKQLALTYPEHGFGTSERAIWENAAAWQPIRKGIERSLTEFSWERAFTVTNLILKPITDFLTLAQLSRQAGLLGAGTDSLILENLYRDARRSQRWTAALVTFLVDENSNNHAVLQANLTELKPIGTEIIDRSVDLVTVPGGAERGALVSELFSHWQGYLGEMNLSTQQS